MPLPAIFPSDRLRELARRRGAGLLLALLVEALILLMLLTFTPRLPGRRDQSSLLTFGVEADKAEQRQEKREKRQEKRAKAAEKAPPQPQPPVPTPLPEPPIELPPSIARMTRQDFAAGDVSRFPTQPRPSAGESQAGADAGPDSAVVGKGANGEPLYAAEWYREPTNAELDAFISERARKQLPGVGLIACRTIARYQVDDCRIIGESPVGSGFGRAVQEAAWQFRVRPPRVGGKLLVGAWVQIRIDYRIERSSAR